MRNRSNQEIVKDNERDGGDLLARRIDNRVAEGRSTVSGGAIPLSIGKAKYCTLVG